MLFKSKHYCGINNNLTIDFVSAPLAELLNYQKSNELEGKHIALIFPKYFLAFNTQISFPKKTIGLLLSKNLKNIPVLIKTQKTDKTTYLYFYLVKNRYLDILIDYQLFFNSINNTANFGIIIFNEKGYVVHVNNTICQLYQYSFHEIIGMHGTSFIHSNFHNDFYRLINDVKPDALFQVHSIEVRKDGSTFNSLVEGKVIETRYGKFLIAIVVDITEQKEKEEELVLQKTLFKKVFELSPIGYFIYDENLIITDSNNAFLNQLNISRESFIGMDIRSVKDKKPFAMLSSIFQLKHATYEGYYTSTISGKTIYTKAQIIPFKFRNKIFALGVSLDLTREKNIEKELTEKQQFYESLINTALTGIGVTNLDENFILVNPAFSNMLGYSVEEMINTNLSNYTTPKQMVLFAKQTEIRKQNESSIYEAILIHRNGNPIHVLIHASPLKDSENKVIGSLGIVVDITYQDFLLKQITDLTFKIENVKNEKQIQLQAIINQLKRSVPLLPEITNTLFNNKVDAENETALKNSLDQYFFILQNTLKQIEIIYQCEKSNYKIRSKPITFEQFNQKLNTFLSQKAQIPYASFKFKYLPIDSIGTILLDIDPLLNVIEFTISNLVIKHATNFLFIEPQILGNNLNLKIQAKNTTLEKQTNLLYFNDKTLCYNVVSKILKLMGGSLNVIYDKVEIQIPFVPFEEDQKNKNSILSLNPNIYTTKIWSSFTLIVVSGNYYLTQLIENMLIPTEINLLKAPVDSQFISFLMQNTIADIVLLDDELFENPIIDYRGLIQRFIPNIPILGILKGNQKADFSYDRLILISENFQDELFAMLSNYLEYGKSNQ